MTLLATVIVLAVLGAIVATVSFLSQNPRCRQLRAFAKEAEFEFQRLAALDRDVRNANFRLINRSEIRHAENQLHGLWNKRAFKCFDYTLLTASGPISQSILLMQCAKSGAGSLHVSHQQRARADVFTETGISSDELRSLHQSLLPASLGNFHLEASSPAALQVLLDTGLTRWLTQHEDVCVEHKQGLLLIYRTGLLLPPDSILSALSAAAELADTLETSDL